MERDGFFARLGQRTPMNRKGFVTTTPPPSIEDYPAELVEGVVKGGRRLLSATLGFSVNEPLVSVITVVKNGMATLPRTIESVLSQDYHNIEYLVIDGQSTDGTLDLLRAFNSDISFWVSEPDSGISDAFNKGICHSRGEIIGILNCDDSYEPGAVRSSVDAMQDSHADIATGKMQYWEDDRKTYLISSDPNELEHSMTVGHPTVFVRRSCYGSVGLYRLDFRLAMDYEWLLRSKRRGARFVTVDRCTANMQIGGVSDKRWRDAQREVARARALNMPGKNTALAYHSYVGVRIVKGAIRRLLDRLGLTVLRRLYQRWFSLVAVTPTPRDKR
jgi:glycosyltransferase involved in cell wall biosynthesis